MHSLVLLLAMVASPPTASQSATLIGSTHPQDCGLYSFSGSLIGLGIGDWFGSGWQFANGDTVEVACNGGTYSRLHYETEVYRLSFFAGTRLGVRQEYYLGHGVVAAFDCGLGTSTASVVWFPTEYMTLSFNMDLLRGQLGCQWTLLPYQLNWVWLLFDDHENSGLTTGIVRSCAMSKPRLARKRNRDVNETFTSRLFDFQLDYSRTRRVSDFLTEFSTSYPRLFSGSGNRSVA